MVDRIFGILQRVGKSFMLPISILPFAGLLLGIGSSMTNTATLNAYGLISVMGPGTVPYYIFTIMKNAGNVVFDNLPVLFAIGVAVGMSKAEKEIGALAAVLAYLVMNATIHSCLIFTGIVTASGRPALTAVEGTITSALGITTLQMGAFGGIIVGIGVAYLNNRFRMTQLPNALSFFEGSRFVLIISAFIYIFVGGILFFVWPGVQAGINSVGAIVKDSGYLGTFAYGIIKRSLIPFGLHHVFYMPFWQTAVGGTAEVGGKLVAGGQNIFFAQLADPSTIRYSVDACRYFTGEFVFMIFGLPGAALAMYHTVDPAKRKKVGSLMLSATMVCIITGITEPLEFAFMFVAPILYIVHVNLAGLAYMLTHMLKISIGLTFSGGVIDFLLFGVMQGNAKTNWIFILPLGACYFAVYYLVFKVLIVKLNLKTPGRETDEDAMKEDEYYYGNPALKSLIPGLGGLDNISLVDSCATRLRVTVHDEEKIDQLKIKESGSAGIMVRGNNLQIIYGPRVGMLRKQLDHAIRKQQVNHTGKRVEPLVVVMKEPAKEFHMDETYLEDIPLQSESIHAFANGTVIPLSNVDDIVFSSGLLGDGFAILPDDENIYSPVNGKISSIYPTKHAIGIQSVGGADILIHIGIDTSRIKDQVFAIHVQVGQKVAIGDPICTFNKQIIIDQGYSITSPLVINNTDSYEMITSPIAKSVKAGDLVLQTNI